MALINAAAMLSRKLEMNQTMTRSRGRRPASRRQKFEQDGRHTALFEMPGEQGKPHEEAKEVGQGHPIRAPKVGGQPGRRRPWNPVTTTLYKVMAVRPVGPHTGYDHEIAPPPGASRRRGWNSTGIPRHGRPCRLGRPGKKRRGEKGAADLGHGCSRKNWADYLAPAGRPEAPAETPPVAPGSTGPPGIAT